MPFEQVTMSDGAEIAVYRASPAGERRGGLVLIQEIFGVTEHIREQCDDYAADGYEVLAPSLYDREHPRFEAGYNDDQFARAVELARVLHPFKQSVADAATCIAALAGKGPVFMTGYCYGGSVTYAAACQIDGLAAASGYYGGLVTKELADQHPKCPAIVHFGRFDQSIPMDGVETFAASHPEVGVYVYEAGHGFNSDRRKDYHEPSADLAKERTLALFQANGG